MKKAFTCGVAGLFLTLTISNLAYSQTLTNPAKLKAQPSIEKTIPVSKQLNVVGKSDVNFRNEISSNAVRNFMQDYKSVTDARWSNLGHGYCVVNFTVDSIKTRIVYDKGGHCENMVRYYFENRLPPAIRHLVKSTYYDFSIYHIIEPTVNGITSYLVQLEDRSSWKTIKVVDGEMEVVEELLKVK